MLPMDPTVNNRYRDFILRTLRTLEVPTVEQLSRLGHLNPTVVRAVLLEMVDDGLVERVDKVTWGLVS